MLHIKQNSHFYTVTQNQSIAQGVRRSWVEDYEIHFPNLFPFQNINQQALHVNIIMW